jgi:ankyrin repeat protein
LAPLKQTRASWFFELFVMPLLLICAATIHADTSADVKQMLRLGDYERAAQILQNNSEDPQNVYQLAQIYQQELISPPRNDSAFELFRQASDAGHVEATYQLAKHFERGEGTSKNLAKARATYQKAMDLGHPKARQAISRITDSSAAPPLSVEDALNSCDEKAISAAIADSDTFTQSWLFRAIDCDGSPTLYTALIDAGANPNARDKHNNLVLHRAVAREAIAAAVVLKSAGADTNQKNDQGWSAAMLAERSDNPELRKVFGIADKQPAAKISTDLSVASREARFKGWSALHIAAWRGDIGLAEKLISDGADVQNVDATGVSPLTRALQNGHGNMATLLLENGAVFSNADFEFVSTLEDSQLVRSVATSQQPTRTAFVCYSLNQGQNQILALLPEDTVTSTIRCGDKPALVLAARNGDERTVSFLLNNAPDIEAADSQGCTALCWAIKGGQDDIVPLLISHGAANTADQDGVTPLMWAAQAGNLKATRQLLTHDLDVNQQSRSGSHPLLLASAAGHTRIVARLLDSGASIDLKNSLGDTALIASVQANHYETAKLLIGKGASTRAKNARFVSARELLASKEERWQQLVEEKTSFWSLIE